MSLPDRATKHIPKAQQPIGASRKGKLKVIDGRTGHESWRQGTKGFVKDYDGDPTAKNHTAGNAKNNPSHHPRMNQKHKSHRAHMGARPTHQPGQSSSDDE